MTVAFRANILEWLTVLASDAEVQLRAVDGLPEELRLKWYSCFFAIDDREPDVNLEGLAQFSAAERAALNAFDDYIWSLPPEPDPMWHRDALNEQPWPQVRARAAELLNRLTD
jgi:hypothetical protein